MDKSPKNFNNLACIFLHMHLKYANQSAIHTYMYIYIYNLPTVPSKQKDHFANCHSLLLKVCNHYDRAKQQQQYHLRLYIFLVISPSDEVVSHAKVGYLYPTRDCS